MIQIKKNLRGTYLDGGQEQLKSITHRKNPLNQFKLVQWVFCVTLYLKGETQLDETYFNYIQSFINNKHASYFQF